MAGEAQGGSGCLATGHIGQGGAGSQGNMRRGGPISSTNGDSESAEWGLGQQGQDGLVCSCTGRGTDKGPSWPSFQLSPQGCTPQSSPYVSGTANPQPAPRVSACERASLRTGLLRGCLGFQGPSISLCGGRAPLSFRGASAAHPLSWCPAATPG